MNYTEMIQSVRKLDLESLSHGIKVQELHEPNRFEAAGLGIIKVDDVIQIYSGSWSSDNTKVIKTVAENNAFDEYFRMIKDVEQKIINANNRTKKLLSKPNGYIFHGEGEPTLKEKLLAQAGLNPTIEYESVKPPIGIIHVGNDYADSWIWEHDAFYGWNIHKYRDVPSNIIKLK